MRGSVARGWEPVARVFAESLASGEEGGGAVCVVERGATVVDVWGGVADGGAGGGGGESAPWRAETLVNVFSCAKAAAAAVVLHLVGRGLCRYEDAVARFWPEFGANGKEAVTIGELLSHQAGLAALDRPVALDELRAAQSGRDADAAAALSAALASQRPAWPLGRGALGYHPLTGGLYLSQLVPRIDPQRRSLRAVWDAEIARPLGLSLWLGLDAAAEKMLHIARLTHVPAERARLDAADAELPLRTALLTRPDSLSARAFGAIAKFSPWRGRDLELPSAIAFSDARSLARLYDAVAAGRVAPPAAVDVALRPAARGDDCVVLAPAMFACGGFRLDEAAPSEFFHGGAGGALGWCDRTRRVSLGYVTNTLDPRDESPRRVALLAAVRACASTRPRL
jgi:CubicO group peptidase (beta-lactamase class C family)